MSNKTLFALMLALASAAPLASAATEDGCCGNDCCCKAGGCGAGCCGTGAKTDSTSVHEEVVREAPAETQRWDGTTKPTAQQFTRQ